MSDDAPAIMSRARSVTCGCTCGSSDAECVYTFVRGLLTTDRWTCRACGRVLHDWTWPSSMAAAREARAILDSRMSNGADPAVGQPAPKITTNGPVAGSTPVRAAKKEQLWLW